MCQLGLEGMLAVTSLFGRARQSAVSFVKVRDIAVDEGMENFVRPFDHKERQEQLEQQPEQQSLTEGNGPFAQGGREGMYKHVAVSAWAQTGMSNPCLFSRV